MSEVELLRLRLAYLSPKTPYHFAFRSTFTKPNI